MEKFNRIYSLQVEVSAGYSVSPYSQSANYNVEITLPNTVEFTITRALLGSSQTGSFKVYNLQETVRTAMRKDYSHASQLRAIKFRCGYAPSEEFQLPLVFNGTVNTCFSYRQGTDWITEINAFDGGWPMANANNVSMTVAPGASAAQTIVMLSRQMPNLSGTPIVGDFPIRNLRGEVLFGNIWTLILEKSNGFAAVDNGQVKALNLNEVFRGPITLISEESGLLGSPKRSETFVELSMLFEPSLSVGQIVELYSTVDRSLNRDWKVFGFEHHGTVSPSICGELLSSVKLSLPPDAFRIVAGQPVL